MSYADDDADDWGDLELPADDADDPDEDTTPCPYCGKPIYEDAVRCPQCENYLSREDAPPRRHPLWIALGALAVLVVVMMWIFFRF